MDSWIGFFEFLGFIAFIQVFSLQGRVSKLEKQLRETNNGEESNSLNDLSESLQKRVGKCVKFDFYDNEEDYELYSFNAKNSFVQIVDVDEKWVHVHAESKNKKIDKLIRISSIKGIEEQN